MNLVIDGININAVSIAGMQTCIELPQFDLCFDVGALSDTAWKLPKIFITHTHMDHIGSIAAHAARRDLKSMEPPTYWLPNEQLSKIHNLMIAWREIDGSPLPCEISGLNPGESVKLKGNYWIKSFRSIHRTPTLGYVIYRTDKKLLPKYQHLTHKEIGDLVRSGLPVTINTDKPLVAFCGDTTIAVIEREEVLREVDLLILECTYLDERGTPEQAIKRGHIHLDQIVERAELFNNKNILLTHFSSKYTCQEIIDIVGNKMPESLAARVHLLLPD